MYISAPHFSAHHSTTGAVPSCTALHCTALGYTVLHCTALHYTILHCTALHYTVLHCTALHYTALHCTALHRNLQYCKLYFPALHCTVPQCSAHNGVTVSPAHVSDLLVSQVTTRHGKQKKCGIWYMKGNKTMPAYSYQAYKHWFILFIQIFHTRGISMHTQYFLYNYFFCFKH